MKLMKSRKQLPQSNPNLRNILPKDASLWYQSSNSCVFNKDAGLQSKSSDLVPLFTKFRFLDALFFELS